MRASLIIAALALATPSIALGQPAPHHAVGQVIDVTGEVSVPPGGGPMITQNRSNVFQVTSGPFRSVLLQCVGRRVTARLEVVEPGPFGGRVEVLSLEARNDAAIRVRVRERPSNAAKVVAHIGAGETFEITGVRPLYFATRLPNGAIGHVLRGGSIVIGEPVVSPTDIARLDAFEFTSFIEWGGDHVQVHLKLTRKPDGSYVADLDGEDLPGARTNVPVSASAVADLQEALERFQSFPEDSFAGDGNHWHYDVRATGERGDGSALRFTRSFYEPGDEAAMRQVGALSSTVEAIARSLSAGPVGGPVTGLIGSIPGQ